ncbi:MAG: glycosyltransferase family protein [Nanoarchaeota archaeon]|nr:glycosyltransferase family protein [Nanoarchaeota archaeon]
MKILYGVAGVGLGHSSRALLIADYLEKKGHRVKIITYGDAYNILKDKFDCIQVKGLEIIFENGEVRKTKTVFYNIKNFSKNLFLRREFSKIIRGFKPDLCISDMEAVVSILSKLYNIPMISLGNHHILTNFKVKIPVKYWKDSFITKQIIKRVVGKSGAYIVSSFANLSPKKRNTFLVPPIIRKEISKLKPVYKNKILVYISKGEETVLEELKKINEKFSVYGFNVKKRDGNLEFRTKETFEKDLCDCKFVIGTSGFCLISESIFLKKPYLAIPIKGHFEQMLNAILLRNSKFGDFSDELTKKKVLSFLKNLEHYKKNLENYNSDQKKIFRVIDERIKEIKNKLK